MINQRPRLHSGVHPWLCEVEASDISEPPDEVKVTHLTEMLRTGMEHLPLTERPLLVVQLPLRRVLCHRVERATHRHSANHWDTKGAIGGRAAPGCRKSDTQPPGCWPTASEVPSTPGQHTLRRGTVCREGHLRPAEGALTSNGTWCSSVSAVPRPRVPESGDPWCVFFKEVNLHIAWKIKRHRRRKKELR